MRWIETDRGFVKSAWSGKASLSQGGPCEVENLAEGGFSCGDLASTKLANMPTHSGPLNSPAYGIGQPVAEAQPQQEESETTAGVGQSLEKRASGGRCPAKTPAARIRRGAPSVINCSDQLSSSSACRRKRRKRRVGYQFHGKRG